MKRSNFFMALSACGRWIFIALVWLHPASIQFVDFRGTLDGAFLKMDSHSSAYAAFDDSFDISSVSNLQPPALKSVRLQPQMDLSFELNRVVYANDDVPQIVALASEPNIYNHSGELKPLELRKRELLNYYTTQDFQTPSLSTKLKEILKRETTNFASKVVDQATVSPFHISGRLRFADGLALTGPSSQIFVYRTNGGGELEKGQVQLKDATFEIDVQALDGFLVAELVDSRGWIVGSGDLSLEGLSQNASLDLLVKPSGHGFAARVASAHSYLGKILSVPQSKLELFGYKGFLKLNEDGEYVDDFITYDSHALFRASAPAHWPTLTLAAAAREEPIKLYPDDYMKSFLQAAFDDEPDKTRIAVLFGRVQKDGKPVSGAQVELSRLPGQVIYFNEFLPDRKLESTSASGEFAVVFYDVYDEVETVRIHRGEEFSLTDTIAVSAGHVSEVNFEFSRPRHVNIAVYEAFSGEKIDRGVHVSFVGDDGGLELYKNNNRLKIDSGKGFAEMFIDAGPLALAVRALVSRSTRDVQLPIVSQTWITAIAAQERISVGPGEGVFLGFVKGDDFWLEPPPDISSKLNLVYFDREGRVTKKGSAGGGFAAFGIPEGLHNFAIHGQQSGLIKLASVFVDRLATPIELAVFE